LRGGHDAALTRLFSRRSLPAVLSEVGLVCAGAAAGATVRYAAHEAYVRLHARLVTVPAVAAASEALGLRGAASHPPLWGVVGVNIAASFVLGALASEDAARRRNLLIGTGFCGGMSSKWWSAFSSRCEPARADAARQRSPPSP
jgi:fluoride ion exporter CrcB/FEX